MDKIFQLLIPENNQESSQQPILEIGGINWVLTEPTEIPDKKGDYTCLSYACGEVTTPHPFNPAKVIPKRTLSAVKTIVEHNCATAIWVDALCIPVDEPGRTACLNQMGNIYAEASEVVVVLSESCFEVFKQIQDSGQVDFDTLSILELDDWVSRVWTYQELVNNSKIRFVAEGHGNILADANRFLRNVSCSIDDYREALGYNWFEIRHLFPRVFGLEDLIVDWMQRDYLELTAFQVICGMNGRSCRNPEEFYFAMIGSITSPKDVPPAKSTLNQAEYFMQLCEDKGDYSFIYATAPRSEAPGKRWRPKPVERLQAIFTWRSHGNGQTASIHKDYIELKEMWKVTPGSIGTDAVKFLYSWLLKRDSPKPEENKPSLLLEQLRKNGFSGCGEFIETEFGYFFPQTPLPSNDELVLVVATGIQMTLGAPGLVLQSAGQGVCKFEDVGLFLGRVPKQGESVKVLT